MEINNDIKTLLLKEIKNGGKNIKDLSLTLEIDQNKLKDILKDLKKDLLVKEDNEEYLSTLDKDHRIGILDIKNNILAFVRVSENESYFVNSNYLNNYIHGDKVLIKITDFIKKKAIIEDKKSEIKKMVGTVYNQENNLFVHLDSPLLKSKIKLDKQSIFINEGDKVVVEFLTDKNQKVFKGKIIEKIGNKDKIGVDVTSIIKEFDIYNKLSNDEIDEVKKITNKVYSEDLKDRIDLRQEKIFTIDGNYCKDFDDAIGIKVLENGHFLVKVNISDVAHYVKENSILDKNIERRGSSIYMIDRTIPMLPYKLCNGICSLNPFTDRLTLTYEMEYDDNGLLVNYDIYTSVIKSKQRMTYDGVEDVLLNSDSDMYLGFQPELRLLYMLSKKIHKIRTDNGYIDYENKYRTIKYDRKLGKVTNVVVKNKKNSEKMIEEYMIAANRCATLFADEHNIPIIRRVQNDKTKEELANDLQILSKMGFHKFEMKEQDSCTETIKKVIDYYKNDKNIEIIRDVLSNNNRTYYTLEKLSHSSLNQIHYGHFTSPTRRYPDLYSSRQIKKYLKNKSIENTLNENMLNDLNNKYSNIKLCYYRVQGLKLGEYYQEKDEILSAKVININEKNIKIRLDDLTSEVIYINNTDYVFDKNTYSCIDSNGNIIKVGDTIFIEVDSIDKYFGKINFKIVEKGKQKKKNK